MKLGENVTVGTDNQTENTNVETANLSHLKDMRMPANSSLLKKRSCRLLSAQIQKNKAAVGGGSTNQNRSAGYAKNDSKKGLSNQGDKLSSRKYNKTSTRLRSRMMSGSGLSAKQGSIEDSERSLQEEEYSVMSPDFKSIKSNRKGSGHGREMKETLPARTIDSDQEDEIIQLLEQQ
jgi:hypothetical protein